MGLKSVEDFFEVVVSNTFYFHPYLGKIPILTNIFQMDYNHQVSFTCLAGNPCRPSFATVAGWGVGPRYGAQMVVGLPIKIVEFSCNIGLDNYAIRFDLPIYFCSKGWQEKTPT